jgi:hypothetical protein
MSQPLNPYAFAVPPDDHLQFDITFAAWWENAVSLIDLAAPDGGNFSSFGNNYKLDWLTHFQFHKHESDSASL